MKEHKESGLKVDSEGNVYGIRGIRKPGNHNHGYSLINTSKKQYLMHRIVAETLIPNPENKPCVNHLDGDKKNNHPSNLEWCTYAENTQHMRDVLKTHFSPSTERQLSNNTQKRIKTMYESGNYSQNQLSAMFGISQSYVNKIVTEVYNEGRTT